MVVLNTVAHFYPQLDRAVKSGKSGRAKPSSRDQTEAEKESRPASQRSGDHSEKEKPRNILNTQVV
jgi:hypothetical protein